MIQFDLEATHAFCRDLAVRLERTHSWSDLKSIYLQLAPLIGRLQGAVAECRRAHPDDQASVEAERALERLKAGARQVGLDIRLASPPALLIGLQTSLESAFETLDGLARCQGGPSSSK